MPVPDVLSFRNLAALVKHLDLYVSNDCGPMHLGPAVGAPTIGIFGPSEPEIWFPYRAEKGDPRDALSCQNPRSRQHRR